MPMDHRRYPPDWKAISKRIRERAGNRCEWCGVPNGELGARDRKGTWHREGDIESMNGTEGAMLFGEYPKIIKIVLTVAHLGTAHADGTPGDKADKMDCRPENLAALCQRCHLNFDRDEHAASAAKTRQDRRVAQQLERRAAVVATGQLELL